nr:Chain B, WD repeat-containing protein 21A [Homo sapiens]
NASSMLRKSQLGF